MAKKKAGGSSSNGRDSRSCRLGIKIFGGLAKPGAIIVRQRGSTFFPGRGCFMSKDYSIHASHAGRVVFSLARKKKIISLIN